MKRGFLNNKKAKNTIFYPAPATSKDTTQLSTTAGQKKIELKVSYGKVENNDIPEDYKPLSHGVKEIPPGSKVLSSSNHIIITSMPPTKTLGDPHNHTAWITKPATKLKVLNIPGFPRPVPKPARRNYVLKETEKMGKGLFAIRDIEFGELIFAERPLVIVPINCNLTGVDPPAHYTLEQKKRVIITEWEKILKIMVDERMEEKDRNDFRELQNSRTQDGSGPILGVIGTNGFGILKDIDNEDNFAATGGYSAVGKIGSRINHSCMNNVICTFATPSFSLQFTAVKDIKAGEQLFYSYTSSVASAQDRQKDLAPYGFVCECYACANATPESDLLHQELVQRIKHFDNLCDEWIKRPGYWLSEKILEPVFELKEAIEKEGLDTEDDFMMLLIVLYKVYMRMGLTAKAEKYKAELTRMIALPSPN